MQNASSMQFSKEDDQSRKQQQRSKKLVDNRSNMFPWQSTAYVGIRVAFSKPGSRNCVHAVLLYYLQLCILLHGSYFFKDVVKNGDESIIRHKCIGAYGFSF